MTYIPVVDALRGLLPTGEQVVKDDSAAAPRKFRPYRLYVWPRRIAAQDLEERHGQWEDGAELRLRIAYSLPGEGEEHAEQPNREVSIALDDAIDAIVAAIRAHRRHDLWWSADIERVEYDAVRTFDVRVSGVDVVMRMNTPPAFG